LDLFKRVCPETGSYKSHWNLKCFEDGVGKEKKWSEMKCASRLIAIGAARFRTLEMGNNQEVK
jgi:hypothetical protein